MSVNGRFPTRAFINIPTLTPQDTEELLLGVNKRFEINIGDDVGSKHSAFVLSVRVKGIKKPGDISVGLNGFVLEDGVLSGEWTEFEIDKNFLEQGINVIEIVANKQEIDTGRHKNHRKIPLVYGI